MTEREHATDGGPWTLDRLERLLDQYGAMPAHWPVADRDPARDLIGRDPAARAMADAAAQLDRLLTADQEATAHEPMALPEGLRSRILAAAPTPPSKRRRTFRWAGLLSTVWPFEAAWQPASALVAAGVLGFVLGLSGINAVGTDVSFDSAVDTLVFGPTVTEDALL